MASDGSTTALPQSSEPAGLWARFIALAIDFLIAAIPCALVAGIVLSFFESDRVDPSAVPHETKLDDFAGYPLFILLLSACFALFWRLGGSPGMATFKLRSESKATERQLSFPRAVLRAFLTALFVISCFVLIFGGFGDSGAPWNNVDYGAVVVTGSVVILGLVGYLAAYIDTERRTLQDRLAGVRVIRVRRITEVGEATSIPTSQ